MQLFNWSEDFEDIVARRLTLVDHSGGNFKFSSASLPDGQYGLRLHVLGTGKKVSATVDHEPTILYPPESEWPLDVEVPSEFTQYSDTWFFQHGARQT